MKRRRFGWLCGLLTICLAVGALAAPDPVPAFLPMDGMGMSRAVPRGGTRLYADYDYLRQINPDVTGWLTQEGTPVNGPVLQGADNVYYLDCTLDFTPNRYGSIFMDCESSASYLDPGTYLYGLDNQSGGPFSTLRLYWEQAYYDAHPRMLLLTPYADYQVDLFAAALTSTDDSQGYRVPTGLTDAAYAAYIDGLCAASPFACTEDARPLPGDRILALVTCSRHLHDDRHVLYGRMRPIRYAAAAYQDLVKRDMDARPTGNGVVTIEGVGDFQYYAQNDALWNDLRYEAQDSGKYRRFGDGGCGPTAVAMAVANLVDKDQLPVLGKNASYRLGYTFCACSVNRYYCNHTHAQYQLKTADEFLRYLPLAVANFATGNNVWGMKSRADFRGTSIRFLDYICEVYGLTVTAMKDVARCAETLRLGGCAAVALAIGGGPFTATSHYVTLVGADDRYLYLLDPLRRDTYEGYQRSEIPEILSPGVVRVPLDQAGRCGLYAEYLIRKKP